MDEKQKVNAHLSRARKLGVDADLTFPEWETILRSWSYSCVYCGGPYREIDHVIPLSEGGGTTAANCVPACQNCNRRKQAETWSVSPKQLKLWR